MDANWFNEALSQVSEHPLLQGTIAALSTFVLEDPTTIGCGLLVADGKMAFQTAFLGVSIGIALGDLGLYGIGRWLGSRVVRWGLVSPQRLQQASGWFHRNLISAIVLSRFIPGMRLPTYLGAGVLGAPVSKFLAVAVAASVVWTFLLLRLTISLGEAIFPFLGKWKWPAALAALALVALVQWWFGRRRAKREENKDSTTPQTSLFEFWPPIFFYVPVGIYYVWLSLRFRSFTLPTISNPSIYSGGLIGESKSEILGMVSEDDCPLVAPYVVIEKPRAAGAEQSATRLARRLMNELGLAFPVVAKPDVGQRGAGVRPIRDEKQLLDYVKEFPAGSRFMLQELVDWPGEAGVLYYRKPGEREGRIFSLTLKYFPSVRGDGRRTLRRLILDDDRASRIREVYFKRHDRRLDEILGEGEVFPLVFAGNHCQGAIFKNATEQATDALLQRLHEIAGRMPEFYFGRFDVKFQSLELFLNGKSFKIVEINGAGAEATHIWDARTGLREAYGTLFKQFRLLFLIGDENRRRGYRPLGPLQLLRSLLAYRKQSLSYPMTE